MKANELMVGNYITFKDCQNEKNPVVLKIWQINEEGQALVSIDFDETLDEIEIDDETAGIPLTDVILDKNFDRKEHGWQVKDCWKIWANPNYGYILATLVMDDFGGGSYEPCIPCTYLHELQNAMTVLRAGKEIKP